MALPASDSLSGTATDDLGTSSDWTQNTGALIYNTAGDGVLCNGGNVHHGYTWVTDTFDGNHWSRAVGTWDASSNKWLGVTARGTSDSSDVFYLFDSATGTSGQFLVRRNSGATTLGSNSSGSVSTDALEIQADGDNLICLENDVGVSFSPYDDASTLSGGGAGVGGYATDDGSYLQDWTGGDIAAAGGASTTKFLSLLGTG